MDESQVKPPRPPPAAVLAARAARCKLAEAFPAGCQVRAVVPLAHPRSGQVVSVLGVNIEGELQLSITPDYIAHANPDQLEIVANELDTDPF